MTTMIEICIEELDRPQEDDGLIRCVALPGGQPGLALDREGAVRWMPDTPEACGLWTSLDGRLVLLRAEGSASITVERGRRSLESPVGQPVFLLDQDLLRLGGRSLRVHVHGETEAVYAPERVSRSALGRLARAAAAAATLALGGSAVVAAPAGPPPPIEVRQNPPGAPARQPVLCTISKQDVPRGGKLRIHATCAGANGLSAGNTGQIVEARTNQVVPGGTVRITTVTGNKIVAEALTLTKPVTGAVLRFWGGF